MTHLNSTSRLTYSNNASRGSLFVSLKAITTLLSCVGIIVWTYYTLKGYDKEHWDTEKDIPALVYNTYFCTQWGRIERFHIMFFSICHIFIYIGLFVGALKVHKQLLQLCWTLMLALLLKRIHGIFLSGCEWDYRVILCLDYASIEFLVVLVFLTQIKRNDKDLKMYPRTLQTQLSLQEFSSGLWYLNHVEPVAHFIPPVIPDPILNYSSTNSYPSIPDQFVSVTVDISPLYDDSVNSNDHPSMNIESFDCPPSYVEAMLRSSTDLPPSYEDCVNTNPPKYNKITRNA